MSRILGAAVLVLVPLSSWADEKVPAAQVPTSAMTLTSTTVARLMSRFNFVGDDYPANITLGKVLDDLLKERGLNYKVRERALCRAAGQEDYDVLKQPIADKRPLPNLNQVRIREVVQLFLDRIALGEGETLAFFPEENTVVITTRSDLDRDPEHYPDQVLQEETLTPVRAAYLKSRFGIETPAPEAKPEALGRSRRQPLVVVDVEQQPISKVLQDLAEQSGASVLLNQNLKESENRVSARLKNVPLDTAVTLLANLAQLKVVQLDHVLFVTSRNEAETLRADRDSLRPTDLDLLKKLLLAKDNPPLNPPAATPLKPAPASDPMAPWNNPIPSPPSGKKND